MKSCRRRLAESLSSPAFPFRALAALLLLCLLVAVPGPAARAVEVEGLFEAAVVVESRAEGRERQAAFTRAMEEVLVKVTGKTGVAELGAIRAALRDPQSYVESWAYRGVPAADGSGERIELEVTFFQPAILNLLNQNNIAVWASNRPLTLVWLAVQPQLGERELLGSASRDEVTEALRREARERGLPLLFPLLDLEDRQLIGPERIWSLDREALREASRRYGVESILVMRVFRSLGGENLARVVYQFREREITENIYQPTLEALMDRAVDLVADELSGYYGVLLSGTGDTRVMMTVEGVADPQDYASLLRYVEDLAAVNEYSITSVNRDILNLELATGGQIRQLVESIALDDNLQPVGELTRRGNEVFMHYRWNE